MTANQNVDVAIRYLLQVVDRGMKSALTLTRDFKTASDQATAALAKNTTLQKAQADALEKTALRADKAVATSAVTMASTVNKALDSTIAKQRELGLSYEQIIKKQAVAGRSAAELAASVERSSAREIAAMQRARLEADRGIRQRFSAGATRFGSAAGSAAAGLGGLAIGGLAAGAGLSYLGLERSRGVTEGMLAIRGSTHLPTQQALALATIGSSLGIAPRSIGMGLGTLATQLTAARGGSARSISAFQALGISAGTTARLERTGGLPALFDLVTRQAGKLPAAQGVAVQRQLLGRGSQIVGQLTAGGSLTSQIGEVRKDLPGIDPRKLVQMQEAFIRLKEVSTAFELSFAQAFGPSIAKALQAVIPLMKPVAGAFQTIVKTIGDVAKGPVGQGLARFGTLVFNAGRQLLAAFKPAEPFFRNVLLPLLKGVAEGVGIALIGAIKLLTPVVRVLSDALGAVGNVMAPLKTVVEDLGKAIGVVFSGGILKVIAEGFTAVGSAVPLAGKALELIAMPIRAAGEAFNALLKIVSDVFGKIPGLASGAVRGMIGALGAIAGDLAGIGTSMLNAITGAFSAVWGAISGIGKQIVDAIVNGIKAAPSAIVDAIKSIIPGPIRSALGAVTSGAGSVISGLGSALGLHTGGWVPGDPNRDGTLALLAGDEFVLTGHGQQMLDQQAPGLLDHIAASQLPHFQAGGSLGWTPKTRGGHGHTGHGRGVTPHQYITPGSNPPSLETVLPSVYRHQQLMYRLHHPHMGRGTVQGLTITGPVSTFGPPGEAAHGTAYGGSSSQAGIALNPHGGGAWNDALANSLAGKLFRVSVGGHSAVLRVIDKGPSASGSHGPRKIDITGAGARLMGINPAQFPTDSTGTAVEVVGGVAKQTTAATLKTLDLTGQLVTPGDAFSQGYQGGLKGQGLAASGITKSVSDSLAVALRSVTSSGGLTGDQGVTPGLRTGAGKPVGGALGVMIQQANAIASRRYNYEWGGGHNASFSPTHGTGHGSGPGIGYDCSGAVSNVLHSAGLLRSSLTAGQFMGWGLPGKGRNVSIYASPTHTFMQLGGRYFGTSTMNKGGGAGWIPRFPESMPAVRHPPGMRRGGRVGHRAPTRTAPTPLQRATTLIGGITSAPISVAGSDTAQGALGSLGTLLDQAQQITALQLNSIALGLAKQLQRLQKAGASPIRVRDVTAALAEVQAAIGNRIGMMAAAAENTISSIDSSSATIVGGQVVYHQALTSAADQAARRQGLTGSALTSSQAGANQIELGVLGQGLGGLNSALGVALKTGAPQDVVKDLLQKISDASDKIAEDQTKATELTRQLVEGQAQERADAATHAETMSQAGLTSVQLHDQLNNVDPVTAAKDTAGYITSSLIPAMRADLDALTAQQQAAQSVGDVTLANQIAEAIVNKTNDIEQQKLDALNAVKDATQTTANALGNFGGTTGFQYRNTDETDLVSIGVGQ